MDDFRNLPPVARTLTLLTFVESALVYSRTINYYLVPFIPQLIFKFHPQIWRLFTPFLLTDPKLNIIFDLYFLYTYSSRLEFSSPRFSTPGSFFIYVLFVATTIMLTAGFYLGAMTFTQALILAFTYTYSQDNNGTRSMFFVVEIPTLYLPWARLALTFCMKGWFPAAVELTGIFAAHLYDFLTRIYPTFGGGKNYIVTPAFVQRWFTRSLRGGENRVYGQAYRPPNDNEDSQGWSSSVRSAWDSRGSGRRLGGN
ncbi:DER1-domain-containing protein [Aspergillus filifer]